MKLSCKPQVLTKGVAPLAKNCEYCKRAGKLVIQEVYTHFKKPWVFRCYLCPWHLGASNRWAKKMGVNFRQLREVPYQTDEELLRTLPKSTSNKNETSLKKP